MDNTKIFNLTLEPNSSGVFNLNAVNPKPVNLYLSEQKPGKDYPLSVKIEDEDHFYQDAAFWLSLAAIIISVFNYFWAGWESKKARKRSIHDDFWLREVIYPNAIKPCLDFFTKVTMSLPRDNSDPTCNAVDVESFRSNFEKEFSINSSQLLIAGYISKNLYDGLLANFNDFQDQIIDYCFQNKDGYEQGVLTLSRAIAIQNISNCMTNFLKTLQLTQESIG